MTLLEQQIYSRGLETIYASVLLDETNTLGLIEHLVTITRYLKSWGENARHMDAEIEFIRCMHAVCYPEQTMEVICEGKSLFRRFICPGILAEKICSTLFKLEEDHIRPDCLMLSDVEEGVTYIFMFKGEVVWNQTVLL